MRLGFMRANVGVTGTHRQGAARRKLTGTRRGALPVRVRVERPVRPQSAGHATHDASLGARLVLIEGGLNSHHEKHFVLLPHDVDFPAAQREGVKAGSMAR